MQRYFMEKRRDTFHFRGVLRRMGMEFDKETRRWYANDAATLAKAMKFLQDELDREAHGMQRAKALPAEAEQSAERGEVEPHEAPQSAESSDAESSAYDELDKAIAAAQEKQQRAEQSDGPGAEAEAEAESSNGEGGEGESDGEAGEPPTPFLTFATKQVQFGLTQAAMAADAELQQVLSKSNSGAQQAQQQQQAQQRTQKMLQQAQQKMQEKLQAHMQEVQKQIETQAEKAAQQAPQKHEYKFTFNDAEPVSIEGEFVPDWVAEAASIARTGTLVRLVGPAGCGKSHGVGIVAKILQQRMGFVNFSEGVTEADLYGFRHIEGDSTVYVVPELSFADCFEHGGVWLGDEFDRANPNVLTSLNAAFANGHLSLPKRKGATVAKRSESFFGIVACNTWSNGPTSEYVSANKQDASTNDRFLVGTIYVDYNKQLEDSLMPDKVTLARIWKVRDAVMSLGLKRVVSTRFIADAAKLQAQLGWNSDKVMFKLTQPWSEADKQKVASM